jgi:septal ring-binding cell division protein DamX
MLADVDVEVDGGKKYVLQVGAFRDVTAAQRGAREIELAPLRIIATRRNAQNWYVLVLGAYEELVDAREAGAAYRSAYPRGGVWIRTAADLEDAREKP